MCQLSTSRSGPKPVEPHLSQGLGLLVAAVDPSLGVLQPRPEALLGPDFEKELEIKGSFCFTSMRVVTDQGRKFLLLALSLKLWKSSLSEIQHPMLIDE